VRLLWTSPSVGRLPPRGTQTVERAGARLPTARSKLAAKRSSSCPHRTITTNMRALSFAALIIGVVLIPTALGLAKMDHDREVSQLERTLVAETDEHGGALDNYFARARSVVLLTANSPAFANVLEEPGTRAEKVRRQGRNIAEVTHHLRYLERLYPTSIGEACFIDADGEELARVVRGDLAAPAELSTEEEQAPFFAPTFALDAGQTHQTRPYVSPDTKEWVVANATLIPQSDAQKRAIVHFEVTVESFRRAMGATKGAQLRVVDARSGRVVIDAQHPQRVGARLGDANDRRFIELATGARASGVTDVAGRRTAYRRLRGTAGNANDWLVVATAEAPTASWPAGIGPAPLAMLAVALVIIVLSGVSLRAARRELEAQATTDALTGLGNRRKLLADVDRRFRSDRADEPTVLTLFDLNGFKNYNDAFGHPAGDALLARLGRALAEAVAPFGGTAYRPGGDEFCVLGSAARRHELEQAACEALSESGEGFAVSAAFGSVVIPNDAGDAAEAMRKADEAMYAQKHSERANAGRQSTDVLLRALAERHPDLGDHLDGVTELAADVARGMDIDGEELAQLLHAANLHDIGKVAIPDGIITKPAALNEEEWAFMRRHTLIGERILAAAPALGRAAKLVRSSHEAYDGSGYPDGLSGIDIPLGARIIAVCDAFDAMVSTRPYSPPMTTEHAVAELRRCAGTQFDPAVVDVFERVLVERARPRADLVATASA
jgi:diguanylate cyclase (GGDEF)-like protein